MSQVCALWNLGSKGQRSRSQCKDYWKRFLAHNCFPFTPIYETSHAVSPWAEYGPYGLWGQKVKGQGHNARITENGCLAHNCFPIWCITWIVWIGCRGGYFVPLGQPHSSWFLAEITKVKDKFGGWSLLTVTWKKLFFCKAPIFRRNLFLWGNVQDGLVHIRFTLFFAVIHY